MAKKGLISEDVIRDTIVSQLTETVASYFPRKKVIMNSGRSK